MVQYHELKHPRKISDVKDGEIANYGSSDGGTTWHPIKVNSDGSLDIVGGLVPDGYDYIALSYTGSNLTGVEYRTGGAGGSIVATLTLAYNGSDNLETITKT